MFFLIHITPDIFSGKTSWEESCGMSYPPLQCSAVMSWHAASIASWMHWTFGPVDDGQKFSISRLIKSPQRGWGKRQGKETSFSNGCQIRLWLHWEWWYATLFHAIIYWQVVWSPTCPLFLVPVFGTDLLKSHIYALFHTRSAQRDPLLLYIIWPCD